MFDKRLDVRERLDPFLIGLENEKISEYYLNLKKLHKTHTHLTIKFVNSTATIKEVCYEIQPDRLKKTSKCMEDLQIILDEHAASSLILSSFYPQNILFSEFLTGHVKVKGIKLNDILAIL